MNKPVGASVKYRWDNDDPGDAWDGYISFGYYIEDQNEDSYGVNDEDILYYAEDEEELKKLARPTAADFIVLSYELEYMEETL